MNHSLACLLCLLVVSSANAQKTYTIRIKEPAKGTTRQNEAYEYTKTSHKVFGPDKKLKVNRSYSTTNHALYHEVILEQIAGQKLPQRLRRYYYKAVSNINGKEEVLPYQKKYVLISQTEKGPYQFQIEREGQLTGPASHLLQKEFNAPKAFDIQRMVLPTKPVQVNERWKLDMKRIASTWEKGTKMSVNLTACSGVGQLVKVYEKEGHEFGVLQFHLEMPLQSIGPVDQGAKMLTGSKVVMDVTFDVCIDGSVSEGTLQGKFKVDASAVLPSKKGGQAQMQLNIEGQLRTRRQEVKKQ